VRRRSTKARGWDFDLMFKRAMVARTWTVDANGDDVLDWFRHELTDREWTLTSENRQSETELRALADRGAPVGRVDADFYLHGSQKLTVRVFGRVQDALPWLRPAYVTGGRLDSGLHHDVTIHDDGPDWRP
jgi:hypothetical protein